MKIALKILSIGAALAVSSTMAFGSSLTLSNFGAADPGGTVLTSISPTAFPAATPGSQSFGGTYSETVYQGGTNSECATCLTFVFTYDTTSTVHSTGGPDHLSFGSTADFTTLNPVAGYVGSSGTYAPTAANDNTVSAVDFDFGQAIGTGKSSDTLVVETNALYFANNGTLTADDGAVTSATVYAPWTSAAPEPSSLALLGTGLLGLAGAARRRFSVR